MLINYTQVVLFTMKLEKSKAYVTTYKTFYEYKERV